MNDSLSPEIVAHVNELLKCCNVGICAGNIRLLSVQSGMNTLTKEPCGDRFKLVIPYAGHSVTWEVLFFGNSVKYPPDFLFDDDDSFFPDLSKIEPLRNWDSRTSTSLLLVIKRLIELYRSHQVSSIEEFHLIQFEYLSLIQQADFSKNDIEIQMYKKKKDSPVNFLIKLPINFSNLPPVLFKHNPGKDSAVLLVTFQSPDGPVKSPQLLLSPRVENVIGDLSTLRLPPLSSNCHLMDYVPVVSSLLQNKIDEIVNCFKKRKEYVAAFLSHFGRSVIEYDSIGLSRLTFLFEWKDFYFIVYIEIPVRFPRECPVLVFQSIYHGNHGCPYTSSCREYPYSPRWSASEMAERARTFILDYIPSFQKNSVRA